jgi:putative protease
MKSDRPHTSQLSLKRPELLAPAGNWDCAKAAVENGADAIYFGLERFNARMRAQNFTEADLPRLMQFLHLRGVKGYVTLNTLIFPQELAEAQQYLRTIITAGVDAVIVQDIGICRLIRHLSPDFPIHASTQMTITSAAGVEFAKSLGCQLVVLARECSLKEINKIQQQITQQNISLPLEVFVHGALCVAYSGQCLTSEALGGRSANRGECAQACRMPYNLIADGKVVNLENRKYLLSPQDLAGLEVLPDLVTSGVTCLKIEGRLKAPEYVANVTRVYRQALDRVMIAFEKDAGTRGHGDAGTRGRGDAGTWGRGDVGTRGHGDTVRKSESWRFPSSPNFRNRRGMQGCENIENSFFASPRPPLSASSTADEHYNLEMAFSRGLYTGWFSGINNQELVHARFGKKRGVYLGEVTRICNEQVTVKLEAPVKPGDGIVFDSGHPEAKEEGGRVYGVVHKGKKAVLTFGRDNLNLRRIHVGDKVWKTSDPELDKQLRQSFAGDTPQFQRPIYIEVHGEIDQSLVAIARDELGNIVQVESVISLVEAHTKPLVQNRLQEQFGRLGNTPFYLGTLTNHLAGSLMLPVSELNRIRREIVTQLEELRSQPKRWQLQSNVSFQNLLPPSSPKQEDKDIFPSCRRHCADGFGSDAPTSLPLTDSTGTAKTPTSSPCPRVPASPPSPSLIVLVRNLKQLQAALQAGIQTLYCEFEDPRTYREALQLAHRRGTSSIWVAPPRISKPGENWILQQLRACEADGYLVRNYDHLQFFGADRCVGDFSLNVANPLTADYLKNHFGLQRVTASYDLNINQLEDLLNSSPPQWYEVTIHQHMPMFHMEHCVFCAFLSTGTDYTNCGRPCEKHDVKLKDRVGSEHILKADTGCRNTVFNGTAQTGAEYVQRLIELGLKHFRIEFVNETPKQVTETIHCYQQLLQGEITGSQLWRELKLQNQLGVTRGPLGV